jgi:serine/threonine protein kinase
MPLASHSLTAEIPTLQHNEEQCLDVFLELCQGVQAIHSSGAVHRDIKPHNALRMPDGSVVVSDLGLGKIDPRDTTILTDTHDVIGTQAYWAPEQTMPAGSRDADQRTDIFQLGKTLYQLLTGLSPSYLDLDRVPRGLRYIVEKATKGRIEDRFESVPALLDAIETYNRSKRPGAHPKTEFEQLVSQAQILLEDGKYDKTINDQILQQLALFQEEPDSYLEQFLKIPVRLLRVFAETAAAELIQSLKVYVAHLDDRVGGYAFEYAEAVGTRMKRIFAGAESPELKALAIEATLIAAVGLHRFAAMDMFNEMLMAVKEPDDVLAVVEVLERRKDIYAHIAGQIPRSNLHVSIRALQENAVRA